METKFPGLIEFFHISSRRKRQFWKIKFFHFQFVTILKSRRKKRDE